MSIQIKDKIISIIRADFDQTPKNWGGDGWYDNAEEVADSIVALFASPQTDLVSRAEVLRVIRALGDQDADLALYGAADNVRAREYGEAAATRACCAIALMPPASPSPAPAAVKELVARLVKPLEWSHQADGDWTAAVIGGKARVWVGSPGEWKWTFGDNAQGWERTRAEAIASLTAAYTARILSALDTTALSTLAADKARIKAERGEAVANGADLRVIRESYLWSLDINGNVMGLTAGDMGFEKTGIIIDPEHLEASKCAVAAAEARASALEGAMRQIASQKTVNELCAEFGKEYETDWEGGYDQCIATARAAIRKETP